MSRPYVSVQLAAQVVADAGHRCGYCRSDERITGSLLSIEHILPVAAGGVTACENLWRSCRECNERKGVLVEARDPESGGLVALFNPRTQHWDDHFRWSADGLLVIGVTAVGQATVAVLALNRPHQIVARQRWVVVGWHPPHDE